MATKLCWAGTNIEARWLPAPWYRLGQNRTWSLELLATTAYGAGVLTMAADVAGWAYVSLNGGSSYTVLPTTVQTGVALGAVAAGDRIALMVKLNIPLLTSVRSRRVGLLIGEGT